MPAHTCPLPLKELQTGRMSFELVNEVGVGIDKGELTTLTLTLYDADTLSIINNRDNQNALDVNDVFLVTTTGPMRTVVTWSIRPEDTVLLDAGHEYERRIALFRWSWGANPTLAAAYEIDWLVENLAHVP